MVTAPTGPALAVFSADWTNIQGVPAAQAGPQGVTFAVAKVGTWEPIAERQVHFTGVRLLTDATGALVGSVTIDGHPRVSEEGQSIVDDDPETTIIVRDATQDVIDVIEPFLDGPPATGVRMGVGAPGFPEGMPEAGTQAAWRHDGTTRVDGSGIPDPSCCFAAETALAAVEPDAGES
jgi:hypothetical protein